MVAALAPGQQPPVHEQEERDGHGGENGGGGERGLEPVAVHDQAAGDGAAAHARVDAAWMLPNAAPRRDASTCRMT